MIAQGGGDFRYYETDAFTLPIPSLGPSTSSSPSQSQPSTSSPRSIYFSWEMATLELWESIDGNSVQNLINDPRYHDSPTTTTDSTGLLAISRLVYEEKYNARLSTYMTAPVTRLFTFWFASNNNGELY